jgi:hypothetical protein
MKIRTIKKMNAEILPFAGRMLLFLLITFLGTCFSTLLRVFGFYYLEDFLQLLSQFMAKFVQNKTWQPCDSAHMCPSGDA